MKIIQLVTKRQYRGAELFAAELSSKLKLCGHDILYVGLYASSAQAPEVDGGRNIDLSCKDQGWFLDIKLVYDLGKLISKERPDIIQANASDTLQYAIFARMLFKLDVPIIYRNASISSSWLRSFFHKYFNKWLFTRIDHIVSVSNISANDLEKTYKLDSSKISVIHGAINLPKKIDKQLSLMRLIDIIGRRPLGPVIMHMGNFAPEKNHQGLLRIFERVKVSLPQAILILIGDGKYKANIEQRALRHHFGKDIIFAGLRSDMKEFLASADVFLLPSLIEGLPRVIIEAQAYGVPVVAYGVGGLSEVVIDSDTGYLVEKNNEEAAASKVVEILSDRKLQEDFSRNAVSCSKKFDLDIISGNFLDLYIKIIKQKK